MKTRDYWLKKVDADLLDRAMAKAKAHDPPVSLKWVLVHLLQKWIGQTPEPPAGKPQKPSKVADRATKRPRSPKVAEQPADPDFGF